MVLQQFVVCMHLQNVEQMLIMWTITHLKEIKMNDEDEYITT